MSQSNKTFSKRHVSILRHVVCEDRHSNTSTPSRDTSTWLSDRRSARSPTSAWSITQTRRWLAEADDRTCTASSQNTHTRSAADPRPGRDGPTPSHVSGMRSFYLRRLCANPRTGYAFVGVPWNRRAGQLVGEEVGSSWSRSDFSIYAVGFVADSQAQPLKVCLHRRRKMPIVSTYPSLRANAPQQN